MTPRVKELLEQQLERFREKFGRDPGPNDPVFFDPDADEPRKMAGITEDVIAAMEAANLPAEFIYAYRKTGLLGIGADKSAWDPADVEEWNAAVDEGRAAQATKQPVEPQEQPGDEKLATDLSLSLADVRRWRHSNQHPAFLGEYEFDLTFELIGKRVVRRARAEYKYTPGWEYWDLELNGLYTGWEGSQIGMSLYTQPDEDVIYPDVDDDPEDPRPPAWVDLDLARDGMLPHDLWEHLSDLIDEKCKLEDLERRRAKGM